MNQVISILAMPCKALRSWAGRLIRRVQRALPQPGEIRLYLDASSLGARWNLPVLIGAASVEVTAELMARLSKMHSEALAQGREVYGMMPSPIAWRGFSGQITMLKVTPAGTFRCELVDVARSVELSIDDLRRNVRALLTNSNTFILDFMDEGYVLSRFPAARKDRRAWVSSFCLARAL